ncbi:MAG: DNA-directed RNA polymerase subunit omega [Truepera sp.]|nr:DNA-directed RNA polymerase subunit omega [Truepera sp.]
MVLEGFDKLMSLTDSRYRLSMITALRAAQIKGGIPTTLEADELPRTSNTVSVAMREFELEKGIHWGEDLPSPEELRRLSQQDMRSDEIVGTPTGN